MFISRFGYIMAPLLAIAVAACASRPDPSVTSGTTPSDAASTSTQSTTSFMVTVNHTDMNRGEMSVYVEPTGGVRTLIGVLNSGEQKSFPYQVTGNRNVRLVGVSPSAGNITSPSMTVPVGSSLYWDVSINKVTLRR